MNPVVYEGVVTQSGTMDDGHTYSAEQTIRLEIHPGQAVQGQIIRTENKKFVDGSALLSTGLPLYLNRYLMYYGACRECVRGFVVEGLMCLETIGSPERLKPSDAHWSPHSYYLVIDHDTLSGIAINRDDPADRTNDVGHVFARKV
jgi:hypothetical protein